MLLIWLVRMRAAMDSLLIQGDFLSSQQFFSFLIFWSMDGIWRGRWYDSHRVNFCGDGLFTFLVLN